MREEERLIETLQKIEALFARPATEGERIAAGNALERIRQRLKQLELIEKPVEYRFTLSDAWSVSLFIALLRRGHSEARVKKVLGENFLAFFARVEATRASLAKQLPSTAVYKK